MTEPTTTEPTIAVLDQLAEITGVEPGYWDIFGDYHATPDDVKRGLLAAMGIDAADDAKAEAAYKALDESSWREILPPVTVLRLGRRGLPAVELSIPAADAADRYSWRLVMENGETLRGHLVPAELAVIEAREIDGKTYQKRNFMLPGSLPIGYHRMVVEGRASKGTGTIILAPDTAYKPDWQIYGKRLWGVNAHVYSLRSAQDWGMGDFSSLAEACSAMGERGAQIFGVNPLHALFPGNPDHCSPYSPTDRAFLNPLYIAVEAVPEFLDSPDAVALADSKQTRAELDRARDRDFVDYALVESLKEPVFDALYDTFQSLPSDHPRRSAFAKFVDEMGEALEHFATFMALREYFRGKVWSDWPEAFRDPKSRQVMRFVSENRERLDFHKYLQFEADRQLAYAAAHCRVAEMQVGLYRDLAVGSVPDGAAAWGSDGVFATDARFGAPPDAYSADGQNWGMPPFNPVELRRRAYEPFVQMVRANMRHAGALRIDHVMALMRLYWILPGQKASEGAYVRYPFDDLLGVLALESHRNQCLVIGEDLGTVPHGFRERMAEENILSYRLLYFERWDGGLVKRPDTYPAQAMASATTHDLFTVCGHWIGADIAARQAFPGGGGQDPVQAQAERLDDRGKLIAALSDQGLLPPDFPLDAIDRTAQEDIVVAVHRFLARTPSALVVVNLDDLAMEPEQLNFPGTVTEYPNWRRRLHMTLEALSLSPLTDKVIRAISEERG